MWERPNSRRSAANPNTGCSVELKSQVNNEYFFYCKYIPNIAWNILHIIFGTYLHTKDASIVHQKFQFNWEPCILSDNHTPNLPKSPIPSSILPPRTLPKSCIFLLLLSAQGPPLISLCLHPRSILV